MTRLLATLAVALTLTGCTLIPIPSTGPRHNRLMRQNAPPDKSMCIISCDRPADPGKTISERRCMVSFGGGKPEEWVLFIPSTKIIPKEGDEICH